jgi:hypothetical protein
MGCPSIEHSDYFTLIGVIIDSLALRIGDMLFLWENKLDISVWTNKYWEFNESGIRLEEILW